MNTFVLCSLLATLAGARFLLPSIQKDVDADVKVLDSTLLVDPPYVSFTKETNMTDSRLRSGDALNFYCEAVGAPMVNVYWTLNGRIVQGHRRRSNLERIRNDQRVMIGQNIVGSRLELDCVDERMTGTLSCVADNGIEAKKNSVQISTTGATVCPRMRPARPQIGTWTKSRIEEIGNAVVCQCRKAAAGATIRWENEEGQTVKMEDGFMVLPNGDLLISAVQYEHLGSYTCVAANADGVEDRAETFVYVTDKNAVASSGTANDYEGEH